MTEWKTYRLGDIATMKYGKLSPKNNSGQYPIWSGYRNVGFTDTYNCSKGTIIVVARGVGGTGDVKIAKEDCFLTNLSIAVNIDTDICLPQYFYYKFYLSNLRYLDSGSAQSQITIDDLKRLQISLPSLEEQRRIAGILGAIDDKIENNRRINANLELQAQALYKQWFVDNRSNDWRTYKLNDITLHITDGVHNTVKDSPNGEYYLLSCKNIKKGTLSIGNDERRIDADTFARLRKRTQLALGDILVTSVGTVGEMFLVNESPMNYEFQRSVAIIKPNQDIVSSYFLYATLLYQQNEIKHLAHGAVQQCIFISDLKEYSLLLPNKKEISAFDSVVAPMFEKITKLQRENIELAALRDTLLPKLMSGELRVNNVSVD